MIANKKNKEMVAEAADVVMVEESSTVSVQYTSVSIRAADSLSVEFTRSQSVCVFHVLVLN